MGCIVLTVWLGSYFFGENAGWLAAIALVTCYTFLRNTTTLQMDSALTFGVLLAMVGYFRGERDLGDHRYFMAVSPSVFSPNPCLDFCRFFSRRFMRYLRGTWSCLGKDKFAVGCIGRPCSCYRLLGGVISRCDTATKSFLFISQTS